MSDTFNPAEWGAEYAATWAESLRIAELPPALLVTQTSRCMGEMLRLYHLLFMELAKVEPRMEDVFHRPQLAAVLAAVAEAKRVAPESDFNTKSKGGAPCRPS